MKKRLCLVSAALAVSLLFISCKNFLDGSSMIDELEALIEYANSMYVPVELKANIEATKEMSPFVGTYDKSYKKGDSFELSYEPNSSYMFAGWKATPEDSVIFEDKNSLKTKVTINSEGSTIVIEPVVCARPTVSFLPGNAVAVEKNSDVVITFSHELNLTDEVTLDLIKIVDEFGNEIQGTNFLPPVLDETKKVIIFKSNPENLISFEGNTLGITVKVPAVYNYLYENTKVCMEKDTEYSYKINQETSTKLKLSVAAITPEKGSMNLSGAQEFNIGQKQILTINIKDEEYKFYGWIVQNENGTKLEKETYELYFSFDDDKAKETYINVKNTGSGFTIVPKLKQRPQVSSSFPQLSKVGVDRGTDIQILFDMPMSEESIYWTRDELDKLKDELKIKDYEDFKAVRYDEVFGTTVEIKDKDEQYYYYAYRDVNKKVHFKNIQVTIDGISYLDGNPTDVYDDIYFTSPYFQKENLLVIPTAKEIFKDIKELNVKQLPLNSYVDFVISKDMVNKEGVSLYKDYTSTYYVNSHYDTKGPVVDGTKGCYIAGLTLTRDYFDYFHKPETRQEENNENYIKANGLLFEYGKYNKDMFNRDFSDDSIDKFIENHEYIKPAKILVLYKGGVSDLSNITELVVSLEFCESGIYKEPVPGYETIEVSYPVPNKDSVTFDAAENRIVFDVSTMPAQGVYKIKLLGVDSLGNKGLIGFYCANASTQEYPYCIIDNVTKSETDEIEVNYKVEDNSEVFYNVTAPKGEYLILQSSKYWLSGNYYTYSDFHRARMFAGYNTPTEFESQKTAYLKRIKDSFYPGSLKEPYTIFLLARNIFGNLTIFEVIEHDGTDEIELVEYIPPDI